MELCPCGSNAAYAKCCEPVIKGEKTASTAEQLMRSRYSAYVKKEIGYMLSSLHPDHRSDYDENSTREWANAVEWLDFNVLNTKKGGLEDEEGQVEFVVNFKDHGMKREHHEISTFKKLDGVWYFAEGEIQAAKPVVRANPKVGRNDPCYCGSGKKFKKCCGQ